jgi:hypothetical protein
MIKTASQLYPILLSLVAALLGALAQYFFKTGSLQLTQVPIYKNYYLFGGLISFFWVLVLFIFAFRMGGRMFVVYPVYATTYIWGGLIAYYWAQEPINSWQLGGVALIIAGVSLISIQN